MTIKHRRANISLPIWLHDRMRTVNAQVNWSAVAAEAFEKKLQEMEEERNRPPPPEDPVSAFHGLLW